jgi:diguanylate cyclase (GGDEF)-like protein/PAS domain S-box-containing protein
MADDGTAAVEDQLLKSQIAALEQLLDVYEKSVLEKTDELYAEIAKRQLAEERLKEKDLYIESIVQGSAVALFVINTEHKVIYWNRACEDLTGIKSEDILGTNEHWKAFYDQPRLCIVDIIIDNKFDEMTDFYLDYEKSVLIPDGIRAEGWYPNLGGKNRYIAFDAAPIHDAHGKISAVIETIQDITERKRAEEDLRDSQEYTKVLFTSSHIPHLVMDAETGIYIDCNAAAVQIYGYTTREEVLGKTPLDVSAPIQYNGSDSATEAEKNMQACRENGSHLFEWRHQRPNGQIWDADVHLMLFHHRGKSLIQFTLQDITESKKADQALRESETKFRTIFESALDSIFLMDQDIFIDCNQKTLEMYGCTREQIIGQTTYRFFPEVQPDGSNSLEKAQEIVNAALRGQPQFFEWKHCRYDGTPFDAEVSLNVFSVAGKNYIQGLVHDITERKNAEDRIQYLATHDSLTGLPNRLMFSQLLNHSIQSARRHKRQFAVFFIDLDRFKIVNDTKGHEAGDRLLQEIAQRYKQALRAADVVGRLGGDEFIILIEDVHELSQVEIVARRILFDTVKPMVLLGEECHVTASIGISIFPKDGEDEQTLMKNADTAMYFAKEEGKNNYQFYSKNIQSQSNERLSIEMNLRYALERNELSLHYLAKVNFKTNEITGVEALLRWQNPALGSVTPTQFIPVAEETGLIIPIGKWVMKTACAQNVAWQQQGLPPVSMAINLSLRQLTYANLIEDIRTVLKETGMTPNMLELEITESMMMYNTERMISILTKIKSMGVRLAIDDFGANFSSLTQIKNFPIDTLKIDRSFIRNIPKEAADKTITKAIIDIGKTLSLTVVAEGVETAEQMNYLKEHSCDEMQGYYFSKPIVPEQFADLLRKQNNTPG